MNPQVPEILRTQVARDLRPVKPVATPHVRLLVILLWSCAALVVVPALMGVRFNAPQLGFWLLWGATGAEAMVGGVLVYLALREGIPGLGAPRSVHLLALAAALVLELGTALITHARCPCFGYKGLAAGIACFSNEWLLGLPALGLTLLLVLRAYPLSPPKAGILGGVGSGLLADATQHLLCPISDVRHVLVWHLGAVGALGLLGLVVGYGWQRFRLVRLHRDVSQPS